ncbi:MAG TPA: hypothetical protein VKX45_24340 [Bryobacteraceae bacterium]|jgi:hypothetical protein|nr:hypothetical protein [Bryobacteraceae bacterium]
MAKRKDPAAVALGKKGGKKGGPARAATLTPERRTEIARAAVQARWAKAKEGTDYIVVKRPKMKTTPTVLKSLKQNGTMKTFSQFVAETEGEALYEMANLFPKHTGLPFVVWMSYKGGAQHDVRVKVSPGPKAIPSEMVSVAIRPNVHVVEGHMDASDLAVLKKWIELNHDVLLKYWEGEIDTKDALDAIRQVKK